MNVFTYSAIMEGLYADEYRKEYGAGLADSYSHAAKIIEERYGNALVSISNITLIEVDTVITLPKNIIESLNTFDEHDWTIPCDITGKENLPNEC